MISLISVRVGELWISNKIFEEQIRFPSGPAWTWNSSPGSARCWPTWTWNSSPGSARCWPTLSGAVLPFFLSVVDLPERGAALLILAEGLAGGHSPRNPGDREDFNELRLLGVAEAQRKLGARVEAPTVWTSTHVQLWDDWSNQSTALFTNSAIVQSQER